MAWASSCCRLLYYCTRHHLLRPLARTLYWTIAAHQVINWYKYTEISKGICSNIITKASSDQLLHRRLLHMYGRGVLQSLVTVNLNHLVIVNTPVDLLFLVRRRFASFAARRGYARSAGADLPVTYRPSGRRRCSPERVAVATPGMTGHRRGCIVILFSFAFDRG